MPVTPTTAIAVKPWQKKAYDILRTGADFGRLRVHTARTTDTDLVLISAPLTFHRDTFLRLSKLGVSVKVEYEMNSLTVVVTQVPTGPF